MQEIYFFTVLIGFSYRLNLLPFSYHGELKNDPTF